MKVQITCKKAVELILKKEEKKLGLFERFRLARHLAICNLCKRFLHQNKLINQSLSTNRDHAITSLTNQEKESIIRKLQ